MNHEESKPHCGVTKPSAPAGGAREFADKYGYDLTRLAKISDGILNLMTAFGDYRFAHGERAGYASRNGEIIELRREAVALIADIEDVWTALEMSGYEGEESPARFVRQEREARERAEAQVEQLCGDVKAIQADYSNEKKARERAEGALRDVGKQVTELIKIDAEIAHRRYLPSLENAKTIRDARAIVDQYEGYQMALVQRIKKVADSLRALAALKSSQSTKDSGTA